MRSFSIWFDRPKILLAIVALILVLIRVPFYLTDNIQEDAFIVFRTASNLADFGTYSYNRELTDVGITCHAYAFGVAAVRFLTRDAFIPVVLVINTMLGIWGIYFFAAAVEKDFRRRVIVWVMASLLPTAIGITILGMETSLLLFAVGLALYSLKRTNPSSLWLFSTVLFVLPWIRVDAVGYCLIFLAASSFLHKRFPLLPFAGLMGGGLALAIFNYLTTGHLVNQTALAKHLFTHPDTSPMAIAGRLGAAFFTHSLFLPLGKESFPSLGILVGVMTFALLAFSLWYHRQDRSQVVAYGTLVAVTLAIPLPYIWHDVMFPWYFLISSLTSSFIWIALFVDLLYSHAFALRKPLLGMAFLLMAMMLYARYGQDVRAGKECRQVAAMGTYIHNIAHPDDTLFLEPAGYVPYFSKLTTYEEIGICSSNVLQYRIMYGGSWWVRFLKEKKPTFLFQREHIVKHETISGYVMNPDEAAWFDQNYEIIHVFQPDAEPGLQLPGLSKANHLLNIAKAHTYYLFRLRGDQAPKPE